MEAPLLWRFQYKHCHGYLLMKTKSVLFACASQRWPRSQDEIKDLNALSCWICGFWICEPVASIFIPYHIQALQSAGQIAEPNRQAIICCRWPCHPQRLADVQMKTRADYQPHLHPNFDQSQSRSIKDSSIPTITANCLGFSQVGPRLLFTKSTLRSFWEGGGQVWQKI